ncbi:MULTISPECIES: ABC transporter substrate-binding protein [Streptomyces]|uniref:ABC transporter substrate-binding protein n=2 Tax=Streptomyces TaxID=1883 RepID=A0A3R7EYM3_9ACTN|nr:MULTISPECIES: ABC transporter substrate-binding protein [Streptomyces]KNE81802.1 ABC transporter [Streptomyces fradiae]OFA59127.1 ABC transporter [Streptomyces fradiae]PQM24848.1 ABC transporter substrate-binding protein [Streptomyces xinghaiensis]RKM98900.1 ABC transporter substrate-binding protein [Streptomyces xinghaiensis]RNC76198.1 ABC transporter substrate-binding protein [Streptomyces xinghaiensis]
MKHSRRAAVAAAVVALALAGTGCSTKAQESGGGEAGADGIKTGPGVTEKTIKLAALTDLSGPYATLGKSIVQAQKMWAEGVNKDGGICDRKIEIVVKDHGYDVQKARSAYTEVSPDVLAMPQVVGSPVVASLKDTVAKDKILTYPMAWAASLLGEDAIQVMGTTYDIDMINAVDFLERKSGVKKGDKIGHVYFEGDYGQSALEGSTYAAEKRGMKIVEQKIKPTDTDLSAQVSALRAAKVKAVLISAGPTQTASLVGVSAAKGFTVPVVSSAVGFAPQLLKTPAGPALEKMLHIVTAQPPVSHDLPDLQKMVSDYQKKYPKELVDSGTLSGYHAAMLMDSDLRAACKAKDLTREGLVKAHRSQSKHEGLGVTQDFSDASQPATFSSYMVKPDAKKVGGTVLVEDTHELPEAREYFKNRS